MNEHSEPPDSNVAVEPLMTRDIDKLATALAKAQGKIVAAEKDRVNPHFRSSYATLASVWDACRIPLSENGLAIAQLVAADGKKVSVTTVLTHASGQWIRSELTTEARGPGPQEIGSAITYCRRYGLAAMVGVAPDEDDDGNAAQLHQQREEPRRAPPPPLVTSPTRAIIETWQKKYAEAVDLKALKTIRDAFAKENNPQEIRDAVRGFHETANERLKKKPNKTTEELAQIAQDMSGQQEREPGMEG